METNAPILVSTEDKRIESAAWNDVWLYKSSSLIVALSDERIEEWDTSSQSCVRSRKKEISQLGVSREEMFAVLCNTESQDVKEVLRLVTRKNEIRYWQEGRYSTLATLESGDRAALLLR